MLMEANQSQRQKKKKNNLNQNAHEIDRLGKAFKGEKICQ